MGTPYAGTKKLTSGAVVSGLDFLGSGPAGGQYALDGAAGGIIGATLTDLSFVGYRSAAKIGSGPVSRNLACARWTMRDVNQGMFLACVEDSTFLDMLLTATAPNTYSSKNHALYIERANKRLTFMDVSLQGGDYQALHIYMDSTAAADRCSDLVFDGLVIGSIAAPVFPGVVYRTDRCTIRNLKAWGRPGDALFRVRSSTGVLIDGAECWGGDAFLDSDSPVTLRNVRYHGTKWSIGTVGTVAPTLENCVLGDGPFPNAVPAPPSPVTITLPLVTYDALVTEHTAVMAPSARRSGYSYVQVDKAWRDKLLAAGKAVF